MSYTITARSYSGEPMSLLSAKTGSWNEIFSTTDRLPDCAGNSDLVVFLLAPIFLNKGSGDKPCRSVSRH